MAKMMDEYNAEFIDSEMQNAQGAVYHARFEMSKGNHTQAYNELVDAMEEIKKAMSDLDDFA